MRGSCFGQINSMLLVQLGNDLCYMFSLQNQFLIFKSKHTFLSNAPGPFQFQEWINPAHSSVAKVVLEQHGYAYNLKVFLETWSTCALCMNAAGAFWRGFLVLHIEVLYLNIIQIFWLSLAFWEFLPGSFCRKNEGRNWFQYVWRTYKQPDLGVLAISEFSSLTRHQCYFCFVAFFVFFCINFILLIASHIIR